MNLIRTKISPTDRGVGGKSTADLRFDLLGEASSTARSSDPSASLEVLPHYEEQLAFASEIDRLGYRRPYFLIHDGCAGASTVVDGRKLINFSSYDYLGFNQHPDVHRAAIDAIERFGVSPSASRLVAGERKVHGDLEEALARHYNHDSSLTFVSGYGTNVSVIEALVGPHDLVLTDSLAHNSIIAGARLSGSRVRSFPHNDLDALDDALRWRRNLYRRVLIIAEGLYSMDGDTCDLVRLVEIKERHGAVLMIDDAHGLGVLGDRGYGSFERAGVDPRVVDVWMGTLSKTLAACGGFVAGSHRLVEYLKHNAGGFVFSVALAPALAASALEAYRLLLQSKDRVRRLRANATSFTRAARAAGLNLGKSVGEAIVPVIIGDSIQAVETSSNLFLRGVNVQPIIRPAVADGAARLRFFISSEHSTKDIEYAIACLADEARRVKCGAKPLAAPEPG
jgi:8-amino-7-oxononanoate synthase